MIAKIPFQSRNYDGEVPGPLTTSFELKTKAITDLWRKPGPPEVSTANAPILYKSIKLSTFKRARITVFAPWVTQYDQGGLVFLLPKNGDIAEGKWLKTGIEFFEGQVYIGTVAKDQWADWSLGQAGLQDFKSPQGEVVKGVTLELERHPVENTLRTYVVDGEKRIPIRETTWILSEPETELWIGAYVARPIETDVPGGELVVQFKGWELELM